MSLGSPSRLMACCSQVARFCASGCGAVASVFVRPGKTAFAVMPSLATSFAKASNQVREYRLRRDHPDLEYDFAGNLKVRQKYLSTPGRSNMLYLPPEVSLSLFSGGCP